DAERAGRLRPRNGHRLSVEQHLAGIGPHHAGHDLAQCALAGAVGADQHMHLAGLDLEVAAAERHGGAVSLPYAAEPEFRHGLILDAAAAGDAAGISPAGERIVYLKSASASSMESWL